MIMNHRNSDQSFWFCY